jgi:hypothetical protein
MHQVLDVVNKVVHEIGLVVTLDLLELVGEKRVEVLDGLNLQELQVYEALKRSGLTLMIKIG